MGKAKKTRKCDARKSNGPTNIAARRKKFVFRPTPETDILHKSIVLPAVKNLANATGRVSAISTICNELLEDDTSRFLLLKERIVQKLIEDLVHDPSEDVVALAWGSLYKIAEKEGYDHCVNMFRRDILSKISIVLDKLVLRIEAVASDSSIVDSNAYSLTESVIGLLKCLSEESEQALDAISKLDILPRIFLGLLEPSVNIPQDIKSIAAQCLSSITEDNDDFTSKIVQQSGIVSQMLKLIDDKSPILRICACATVHNLSLAPVHPSDQNISDARILPTLTAFLNYTAGLDLSSYDPSTASKVDESGIKATEIALVVVASIATSLGYQLENKKSRSNCDPEFEEDEENYEENGEPNDAENGSEDMMDNIEALQEDMEMIAADADLPPDMDGTKKTVQELLENTTLAIIRLSCPLPPHLSSIRLRALAALNNIALTLNFVISSSQSTMKSEKWQAQCRTIWDSVVSPVLKNNTADVALADAVTGVAWATASSSSYGKQLDGDLYQSFISLYNAAIGDNLLRSKCVGVLGCLATSQDRIDINTDIGIFLLGLVNNCPETPALPAIEALNAIFDIYADAGFKYNQLVFVQREFLKYLEDALPRVRKMARRVDKKKLPEIRERADETVLNLTRFIQYKKQESSKK